MPSRQSDSGYQFALVRRLRFRWHSLFASARRIIIIAERGAQLSGAKALCETAGGKVRQLLAATLPVRGLFEAIHVPSGSPGLHPAARRPLRVRLDL